MQNTWIWSLGWEGPLKKGKATHSSILAWKISWIVESMGVTKSPTWLSDFHFLLIHQFGIIQNISFLMLDFIWYYILNFSPLQIFQRMTSTDLLYRSGFCFLFIEIHLTYRCFSGGTSGKKTNKKKNKQKKLLCQCRKHKRNGLYIWVGQSPGGGWHGNPLYSCLENPHGEKSLAGYRP